MRHGNNAKTRESREFFQLTSRHFLNACGMFSVFQYVLITFYTVCKLSALALTHCELIDVQIEYLRS